MKPTSSRLLFWFPRILCLLFAAFISIFALDVFEGGFAGWRTVLALLMHLLPTIFILLVLALSWHREWIGALVFTALALCYLYFFRGRFPWSTYAIIAGPLFLTGLLFLLNWLWRTEPSPKAAE